MGCRAVPTLEGVDEAGWFGIAQPLGDLRYRKSLPVEQFIGQGLPNFVTQFGEACALVNKTPTQRPRRHA